MKGNGYRYISIDGVYHKSSGLAFLYMEGYIPKEVDHEDRVRDNDKWENIRATTHTDNMRNRGRLKRNTSGFTGVGFYKRIGKWRARVKVDGKDKHLGFFTDKHDAIVARYEAEQKLGWHESNEATDASVYVGSVQYKTEHSQGID